MSQKEAYSELIKGEAGDSPTTKIAAKSIVESYYKHRSDNAAIDACVKDVLTYDSDGSKTEAHERY